METGYSFCCQSSSAPIPTGFLVETFWQSEWRLAEVVASENDGEFYYVHFVGEDVAFDEWQSRDKVRRLVDTEILSSLSLRFPDLLALLGRPRHAPLKSITSVELGLTVRLQTHYYSPYPADIGRTLFLCESCLGFFKSREERLRHWSGHCAIFRPPGVVVYNDRHLSVTKVDGYSQQLYCERLLLFSKLFLEEKRAADRHTSQAVQVSAFFFFVVERVDHTGTATAPCLVGYFSVMKPQMAAPAASTVLSCILVLPHEQRKGYGKFMMEMAYQQSRTRGSAERPLSVAGRHSFYSFWTGKILAFLANSRRQMLDSDQILLSEISAETGIMEEDIVECLKDQGVLRQWGSQQSFVLLTTSSAMDLLKRRAGNVGYPFVAALLLDKDAAAGGGGGGGCQSALTTATAGSPASSEHASACMTGPTFCTV